MCISLHDCFKLTNRRAPFKDSLSTKMQCTLLLLFWSMVQLELSVMVAQKALAVRESNIEISVEEEPLPRVNNYESVVS